jgi:dynactin complex subunit
MIVLAENVQTVLAVWQFVVVVAVAPVATIVAIMWAFAQNNKRAEQVKMELTKSIADLSARVTELNCHLVEKIEQSGARVTELKNDITSQMTSLKADLTSHLSGLKTDLNAHTSQLRSDMQAGKADAKELVRAEIDAAVSNLKVEMAHNHGELVRIIGERLPPAAARAIQP